MVSLPTYDNNLFARGISNKAFQKLLDEPEQAARSTTRSRPTTRRARPTSS